MCSSVLNTCKFLITDIVLDFPRQKEKKRNWHFPQSGRTVNTVATNERNNTNTIFKKVSILMHLFITSSNCVKFFFSVIVSRFSDTSWNKYLKIFDKFKQ